MKAAQLHGMSSEYLMNHPDCEELIEDAFDMLKIEAKGQEAALEIAKDRDDFKNKPMTTR